MLSSCSERSEYGEKSDYEKLGAACIPSSGEVTPPSVSSVSPTDNSTYNSPATTVAVTFSENMEPVVLQQIQMTQPVPVAFNYRPIILPLALKCQPPQWLRIMTQPLP